MQKAYLILENGRVFSGSRFGAFGDVTGELVFTTAMTGYLETISDPSFSGQIVCLYGMLYSVERFFVEGLRTDSLMIGPLRQAQVLSLALIAACAILYVVLKKRSRTAACNNHL